MFTDQVAERKRIYATNPACHGSSNPINCKAFVDEARTDYFKTARKLNFLANYGYGAIAETGTCVMEVLTSAYHEGTYTTESPEAEELAFQH